MIKLMNNIVMDPLQLCNQIDMKAFLKRRGVMSGIGIIICVLIILFQLYLG
jgi:hypothetical protein